MKKLQFFLLALLITIVVFQSLAADFHLSDQPYLSKEFTLPREGNLEVRTSGASVSVLGHESNQVLVEMYVYRNGKPLDSRNTEVQKHLEDYKIDISQRANKVSVIVENRKNMDWGKGRNNISLSFKIYTPKLISGTFNTSGGGIKANILTLDTELTLKSSGGSISAVVPKGLGMDLDLQGGHVNTTLTNFDGEVKKDKILGKINGGGVPVTMASSGGSINLEYK